MQPAFVLAAFWPYVHNATVGQKKHPRVVFFIYTDPRSVYKQNIKEHTTTTETEMVTLVLAIATASAFTIALSEGLHGTEWFWNL